jgi:D-beta-D-heptose 7-phosphate kinase/D-beta-D-heptose 1-phosphate adenosyltransferase
LASGVRIASPHGALGVGQQLCRENDLGAVVVTLDAEGMALVNRDGSTQPFPSEPRQVYDITGAGDMVLATLGMYVASGAPLSEAVRVANIAAGLEVERMGVSPVTRAEIQAEIERLSPAQRVGSRENASLKATASAGASNPASEFRNANSAVKLTTLPELLQLVDSYRQAGKELVFTNGCFDLLHVGHVSMLEQAAALGDVLIVAINSDAGVRKLKGPNRPVISERDRAQMLAAIGCVDHVLIFDDPTPHILLEMIRPDILAKGGTTREIIGREVVETQGGRVVRLNEVHGISTTALLARLPPLGMAGETRTLRASSGQP